MASPALRRGAWVVAALAQWLLGSPLAQAQPWTGERWVARRPHRVTGEFAFYTRADTSVFSPNIRARFRLVRPRYRARSGFLLDLDLAARSVGIAGPVDRFRAGNPFVGIRMGLKTRRLMIRGGLGTTAPLTNAYEDGLADVATYRLGQAVHGMWDGWLMNPQIQPLIFRGDFELHERWVQVGFDLAAAAVFPLPRRGPGGDVELAFGTGAFAALLPIPELALGVRFSLFFATNWYGFGRAEEAQLSLLPFVRVQLLPAFFELRLLMNLDDPYGFAFDHNGVWALSFLAGGRF